MKDYLNQALTFFDHYRYTVVGAVLTCIVIVYTVSCASQTRSIVPDPVTGKHELVDRSEFQRQAQAAASDLVTERAQLQAQLSVLAARASSLSDAFDAGVADLDAQDAEREQVIAKIGEMATGAFSGTLTGSSALVGAIAIGSVLLGLGSTADNRRKDGVITKLQTAAGTATAATDGAG